jgi:hypothetical protein
LNILKESGNRLRRKATSSIIIAVAFLFALFALGLTTDPYLPIAINWAEYTNFYALFLLLLALGAMRYYRKYQNYRQGFQGEGRVTQYLKANFGEEHFLIDDLVYVNEKGHKENIDHIVLSPNGIFVLETKDYRGKITVRGSFWTVPFPYGRSPSKQVRGNAWWVKKNIDDSMILEDINLWVEPIVVFSNPDVELEVIDPEAEVVKLDELATSLTSYSNSYNFSSEQLKAVGEAILEKSLPI